MGGVAVAGFCTRASEACNCTIRFPGHRVSTILELYEVKFSHTEEGQSIVKSSAALVEALMRNGQPLRLLREHLLTLVAQHAGIKLVQHGRVRIDVEIGTLRVHPQAEWRLRSRRSVGPSRRSGLAGRGFWARGEGAAVPQGRNGTGTGS